MSYYLNENFEPMFDKNYENEIKFKNFISDLNQNLILHQIDKI